MIRRPSPGEKAATAASFLALASLAAFAVWTAGREPELPHGDCRAWLAAPPERRLAAAVGMLKARRNRQTLRIAVAGPDDLRRLARALDTCIARTCEPDRVRDDRVGEIVALCAEGLGYIRR